MSDLVPEEHMRFNRYWHSFLEDTPHRRIRRRRPPDPRKQPFRSYENARVSLSRSDRRVLSYARRDPQQPVRRYWGGTLDSHIDYLKQKLVVVMKLQLIHSAGAVVVGNLMKDGSFPTVGQNCGRCGRALFPPSRFRFGSWEEEENLVDDITGLWREGTLLLERWTGRMISDYEVAVLTTKESAPPGYIPCVAALEAL